MAQMEKINKEQIKKAAQNVLHSIYEELNYPPSIRLATEQVLSAISKITSFQIFTVVIPKDSMAELRGMLITFKAGEEFLKYLSAKVSHHQIELSSIKPDLPVALIFVSSVNNPCWHRFTLVKEAAHLVLESDDLLVSTQVEYLVEAVIKSGNYFNGDNVLENREEAGVNAAVEIFMPESIRDWMQHKINVESYGPLQIAQALMVPQKFVEQRIFEWGLSQLRSK